MRSRSSGAPEVGQAGVGENGHNSVQPAHGLPQFEVHIRQVMVKLLNIVTPVFFTEAIKRNLQDMDLILASE